MPAETRGCRGLAPKPRPERNGRDLLVNFGCPARMTERRARAHVLSRRRVVIFVDGTSRHSRVGERLRYGDSEAASLLFADDAVLLAPPGCALRRALACFAAACPTAGMGTSTSRLEVTVLPRKEVARSLQEKGEQLPSGDEFKDLGVSSTRDGEWEQQTDRRSSVAAEMRALNRSVAVKPELCFRTILSLYRSAHVPVLTSGHDRWTSRAGAMAGARELLCVIQDLQQTVAQLKKGYKDCRLPVTDGGRELQALCAQLEFLLQFDLKEKRSFFGQRRDYWDFLCHGLARRRQGHEGVQFVSGLEKLRTPVGKGRAFIRYCLVHQQLAESLQLCFLDPELTSEWYYARSPFLNPHLRADIMGCLYELDSIAFHLALKRPDLDAAWPMVSETLSRCSSHSSVNSQTEGTAWPVGNLDGDCELPQEARRIPQEASQLPGQVSRSPGLSTDDQLQPGLEESREDPSTAASLERNEDNGRQAGSQQQGSEGAEDGWQRGAVLSSREREAELRQVNAQLQLQIETLGEELRLSLAAGRQLEALLAQQEQHHGQEREVARRCSSRLEEQAGQIRELQESKAFLSDTLEEMDVLASALRRQLSQKEEERAALLAVQVEERRELAARLAEGQRRQQELAERLSRATRDAEREAAAAAAAQGQRAAAAAALEEAERRLRAQEAEGRRHLSGAEAQELRHQQLLSRCRRLQEKLSASEGRLEEKEAQVLALQSQLSQRQPEGPSGSPQLGPEEETAQRAALEARLRQADLQAEGLREKLERGLSESRELEREREALLESAVSQGQSLAAARLETQDLREELAARQERNASLQEALEQADRALADTEKEVRGLQEALEGQSAELRDALSENSALAARLAAAATGFASEKAQLEAREAEERAGHEKAVAELRRRLAAGEEQTRQEREEGARLRKEEQQLQAALRGASEERDILAGQAQTTAAALESRAREAALLRGELEELKAHSQREESRLQAALAVAQRERDALAQQKEEGDGQISALREESLRLRHQVQRLDLEKQRAADSLEQARGQLAAVQVEKDALEEMLAVELERAGGGSRPEAGGEESRGLASGRGLAEEKAAGGAGPQTGKPVLPGELLEDPEAVAMQEKAGPEHRPRKGVEEMVKFLITHLEKGKGDAQQKGQLLAAKEEEAKHLAEQLDRARQDGERLRLALERAEREAAEQEKTHQGQLAEQKELVRVVKARLLELLREKDALWQKTEGINPQVPGTVPRDLGLCARCSQDFGFLARRYQCRLCRGTVCQACSVESGRKGRCCLLCWQKKNFKGT
ncbi:RUN and FYVE domain-containing protein 4 [Emydura macquarii macquarii]|uniref:RUN and FYVE domain-containing protein 4 n=1 Tax=Emydura macquarii macquarii TaxID=1129001 RepID=UPI00352ADE08